MKPFCNSLMVAMIPFMGSVACTADDAAEVGTGMVDALATEACTLQDTVGVPVSAATTLETATLATLPADAETYAIALPASGAGFVAFEVPEGHADWALFLDQPAELTGLYFGSAAPTKPAALRNGACPNAGMDDYRIHIHEAGARVLALSGPNEGIVWARLARAASMPNHDGGHAEHDGGHAEHDGGHAEHDGGHAEHDGGHAEHDGGHLH